MNNGLFVPGETQAVSKVEETTARHIAHRMGSHGRCEADTGERDDANGEDLEDLPYGLVSAISTNGSDENRQAT